jgi:hypothetical protein
VGIYSPPKEAAYKMPPYGTTKFGGEMLPKCLKLNGNSKLNSLVSFKEVGEWR